MLAKDMLTACEHVPSHTFALEDTEKLGEARSARSKREFVLHKLSQSVVVPGSAGRRGAHDAREIF